MLANLQWESCQIYLDDVIAFGSSFDEEAEIWARVAGNLGLKRKPKDWSSTQKIVLFLWYAVSEKRCEHWSREDCVCGHFQNIKIVYEHIIMREHLFNWIMLL